MNLGMRPPHGFSYYAGKPEKGKPAGNPAWTCEGVIEFSEARHYVSYEGFARTSNAVLVLGARPAKDAKAKGAYCVAAVSIKDGTPLWIQDLPGPAVRWGLAVDRDGRVLVTMEDGSILCLGADSRAEEPAAPATKAE